MIIPQPGMFSDWKEWAQQLYSALFDEEQVPARALDIKGEFADDAAAASAGVKIGELYRNGSVVQVRVT